MHGVLTNPQRKHLRRLAHGAPANLQIGKQGLTENFQRTFAAELASHELLKIRFLEFQDEKKAIAADLEAATGAALVSMVGHTAIFYRANPDPEKRKIALPRG